MNSSGSNGAVVETAAATGSLPARRALSGALRLYLQVVVAVGAGVILLSLVGAVRCAASP